MNIRQHRTLTDYLEAYDRRIQQDLQEPPTSNFRWWAMGAFTGVCLLIAVFI